jgi:large conductance mechanosensitive channel
MLKEFKEFAMKGGLIDTAVGLALAGAFSKVTTAFIDGCFMPLLGFLLNVDMTEMKATLRKGVEKAPGVDAVAEIAVKYGELIGSIINFIVVAFVMFMIIKAMNASKKAEPAPPPPPPPAADVLLGEIRDLLKSGR